MFVFIFILMAVVPTSLFWMWPYSKALEAEINDVKDRHLVIAKNLSTGFERYYQDVTNTFSIIEIQSNEKIESKEFKELLLSLEFHVVAVVDDKNTVTCLFNDGMDCPEIIPQNIIELANQTALTEGVSMSTVTEDTNTKIGPILLVVKKKADQLLIGYLSTRYIVAMGKKVAFGEKGHAAIVDQAGNVLAHPLDSWIKERKDMSQISSVQKMLAGKTGVELFYSPALKGDMIAGYTTVANAKWGVMVPQPISELEDKAQSIDRTAIYVMLLGVGLALIITIPVSLILIKPLEQLIHTIKMVESGGLKGALGMKTTNVLPVELKELKSSFFNMMHNLDIKEKEISRLAYFDSQTELPNRNYFHQLSEHALVNMKESNSKGAFVFIDFDDFKLVNDSYGHKVGDELLFLFAKRLSAYFSIEVKEGDEQYHFDKLPDVIPARLGGDEFVILMQNILSIKDVEMKVQGLFNAVFSTYEMKSGVELNLTGSAGISIFGPNYTKLEDIMKSADMAMYEAKALGKNRLHFSSIT